MSDHLIHLICGSTGAGKTMYAKRLAERLGAIYFSIDEWMAGLFWADAPQPLDPRWSVARIDRCNVQIWNMARQIAGRGVPCVLDLGFAGAAQRDSYRRLSVEAGLSAQLHFVDVPPDERWRRVQVRNKEKGDTCQLPFEVTREMFDYVETLFEAPTDDEIRVMDGVCVWG